MTCDPTFAGSTGLPLSERPQEDASRNHVQFSIAMAASSGARLLTQEQVGEIFSFYSNFGRSSAVSPLPAPKGFLASRAHHLPAGRR